MTQLAWLSDHDISFPNPETALDDPNGLLAVGGDLSPERLINAYRQGIFPWYEAPDPILWWSPDPRLVITPESLHIGRTLRKTLKRNLFQVRINQNFESVMRHSATADGRADGTWISEEMIEAYCRLHEQGYAHSIETINANGQLVGGLYGIAIGKAFFGESMFSLESNASKVAFATFATALFESGFELIDCQVETDYLASFGGFTVDRDAFSAKLNDLIGDTNPTAGQFPFCESTLSGIFSTTL